MKIVSFSNQSKVKVSFTVLMPDLKLSDDRCPHPHQFSICSHLNAAKDNIRSGFKTSYRAQVQGVDRRKNGAYMGVCEYFEEDHNTVIVC